MRNNYSTNNKSIASIFMVGVFLFFGFILSTHWAQAAETSTVRGVAWWGDANGEVYFNCLDDRIGDRLDVPGNFDSLPVPRGFHFYSEPCKYLVHGVYLDTKGNFSGKAWSPRLGLISFSGPTPPPGGYGSVSPFCDTTCNASNECWACYNDTTQNVYGYAQVDSDGTWIRLDSALSPPVGIQGCGSPVFPGEDIASGEFIGNASSDLGTLSFNCKSEIGGNMCATRDYEVYISSLTLGSLSAPNWTYSDACTNALGANLGWCKRSGTQTAYEIIISETNSTSSPVCLSGKQTVYDWVDSYPLPSSCVLDLDYDHSYYWWIRLFDALDNPTQWYQYDSNTTSDTDNNRDDNALTFQTYLHKFPSPFFTWSPYDILVGSSTIFSATSSQYYTISFPDSNPQYCTGTDCGYLWTTMPAAATITPINTVTTTIIFDAPASTTITLKLTDNELYYCSTSFIRKINYDLPIWREIKAK